MRRLPLSAWAQHPRAVALLLPLVRRWLAANLAHPEVQAALLALLQGARGPAIFVDYPVKPQPRYGHGKPPHPELHAILAAGRAGYEAWLRRALPYRELLWAVPRTLADAEAEQPAWINGYFAGLDATMLYTLLAELKPQRYFEIGSGNSTKWARRAIREQHLPTRIVSFDPFPRAEVDALCDEVVRLPVEEVPLHHFEALEAGDFLFVDNSHRLFTNSDVAVVFLDILPRLRPGVVVQIHDICLPWDYPPEWSDRYYSEQYVLAAALLAGHANFDVLLPNGFVSVDPALSQLLQPLWQDERLREVEPTGVSFWLRVR